MQQRNREKRDDKEHHEKTSFFFIQLSFRMVFFVLVLRKCLLQSLCSLLCYLFIQENVQTNIKGKTCRSSCSQMFFKIAVLKNLAVLSKKNNLCWSLVFNKVAGLKACIFIKKEALAQVFPLEYCEIFKNSFLYRTFILFRNFM